MHPSHTRLVLSALLCAALAATTACTDREAQRQAQAAAEAEAKEQAATQLQREYDAAVTANNWELARVHGAALLAQYPGTPAATALEASLADVTAKADAAREQRRLAALWNYARVAAGKGEQRSAAIFSKEAVDTGGQAPATVQLVIRDHPEWKRSAYLVLEGGDFDCYGGCKVKVAFDDAAAKPMSAWRPKTDEAIAMFIEDYRGLWKQMRKSQVLKIEFPVKGGPAKAGGTRTAVFEVGGLDGSQMPGWD
jgi:glucose/arabinose dehydrogenase